MFIQQADREPALVVREGQLREVHVRGVGVLAGQQFSGFGTFALPRLGLSDTLGPLPLPKHAG